MKKKANILRIISLLLILGAVIGATVSCKSGNKESDVTKGSENTENKTAHISEVPNGYVIKSPSGTVKMKLFTDDQGNLGYNTEIKASDDGEYESRIEDSALGLVVNNISYGKDTVIKSVVLSDENGFKMLSHLGNVSTISGSYVEAEATLETAGKEFFMDIMLFDNGISFRYRLPAASAEATRRISDELTTFVLCSDANKAWYGENKEDYEPIISEHSTSTASDAKIVAPITAVVGSSGYMALLEGGQSTSYAGTVYNALGKKTYKINNTWKSGDSYSYSIKGDIVTTWRMVNFADSLDALVNNYNAYIIANTPDDTLFKDTSWIEPGRATWSWLVSFASGLSDDKLMYEFTNVASRLGYEYNVVDDGWPVWEDYEKKLTALGTFGKLSGVKELLWCAMTQGTAGINKIPSEREITSFFNMLDRAGFAGAKVDFWWAESEMKTTELQRFVLKTAAERQMIIDFHGCAAVAGNTVTYPNELSREGIRGLEYFGASTNKEYAEQARWLCAQLYTRYLAGHADWTPAVDTAMQIASLVCIDSPLMVIGTNPNTILQNEAVEMIKSIPTVWDKTVVLDTSKIGKSAVYAKESKGNWYVGGIFATRTTGIKIKLSDFLESGEYLMEMWEDKSTASKTKTLRTVTCDDVIEIEDKSIGCGFVIRFSKLDISQHGGEINAPITISAASPDSIIKYTTDGSDPMTSERAVLYTAPISLSASCKLRAAITDKDGKGTEIAYNFNMPVALNTITITPTYNENNTVVSISSSLAGSKLYYTTDGTTPTESSALYKESITITEKATVKVISVPADDKSYTAQAAMTVIVRKKIAAVTPDIFIGSEYTSAVAGWDNRICVNQSMNYTKISLGGTTTANGTQFEHGISTNAVGKFVYAVPGNAARFVGVVGIDDSVYANTTDSSKASSGCTITIDGTEVYKSNVFRCGEYAVIDIAIPEGASSMTIDFTDAGDGITCDNVSLANAGWIVK